MATIKFFDTWVADNKALKAFKAADFTSESYH